MKTAICHRAWELGFDDCRFASAAPPGHAREFERWIAGGFHGEMAYLARNAQKRLDPQQVLPGTKTIISLAVSYAAAAGRSESNAPMLARYAQFRDYHDIIGARIRELTDFIDGLGTRAKSLWYIDTGPVIERDYAERSGLAFIGKHTNAVSRKLGNWIFLSEIITTLVLEPDPPEHNRCGSCSRCITACPTGAIIAPFHLDARRCISYLTIELKNSIPVELRPLIGGRIFGCDECLAACPWNRFGREGRMMAEHRQGCGTDWNRLLSMTEPEFKLIFAGSPILRAKHAGFIRNVCVAVGNVGDESSIPLLQKASTVSPLVAEHALWAIEQIKQRSKSAQSSGPMSVVGTHT